VKKVRYDLLLNWAVTSIKDVDVGSLLYPLGTKELLENFSTDVYCLFTNNEVFIYDKSWSFFAINVKIGIIQQLIILF
jgi:hypothetical protein